MSACETMWLCIFLPFWFLAVSQCQQTNQTYIKIVPSLSDCQNVTDICLTFSQCLGSQESTEFCFNHNTELHFAAGDHLANGSVEYLIIEDCDYLSLIGDTVDGRPAARIHCNSTKAFAILDSYYLLITGLEFLGCGSLVPTRLQEKAFNVYTKTYLFTPTPLKAAILLVHAVNLNLEQCHFNNSNGFALFAMNILGRSTVRNSMFINSNRQSLQYNLTYCRPDSLHTENCMGGNAAFLFQDFSWCPFEVYSFILEISRTHFLNGVNMDFEAGGWYYPPNYIASAGGLSIFSGQTSYNICIQVSDAVIDSNIGFTAANLVVFVHDRFGVTSDTYIYFDNCTISNGNVGSDYFSKAAYAGGVYLYYGSSLSDFGYQKEVCTDVCSTESPYEAPTCEGECRFATKYVRFSNCKVFNNRGLWGAAFDVSSLTGALKCIHPEVIITDCEIWGNTGVNSVVKAQEDFVNLFALAPESDQPFKQLTLRIYNSNIFNNTASGVIEVPVGFRGDAVVGSNVHIKGFGVSWFANSNITNNIGTGLNLGDGSLNIQNTVVIGGNLGVLGGGIALVKEAQLNFYSELHLFIQNNTALLGGGIHIDKQYTRAPNCFFKTSSEIIDQGIPIEIIISNNKASVGLSLYGGFLDICVVIPLLFSEIRALDVFHSLFQISNHSLSEITSDVRRICYCIEGRPQCTHRNTSVVTFPGRTFAVDAVPVGLLDGTVPAVVVSTVKDGYEANLGPQQDAQQIGIQCTQLRYSLSTNHSQVYLEVQPNAEGPLVNDILEIVINFMDCPLGFQVSSSGICDCIRFLSRSGVTCDIEDSSFQRPVPVWIGYMDNAILIHDQCPFDYCKTESATITLQNTDPQCEHKRSGILCGECQSGLSLVFHSSRCKKCSNAYLSLLLVFIPAGFILVLILIYMDFTVARGTFNGLIFYANIIQIHKNVIFPSGQVNPLTVFISWLNLDIGIELCFYDGMDEYGRSWLQFLFPVYIWIIAIFIIITSWYSKLIARISGRNAVAVLATLFLLSYTKLQRNILQILTFTYVRSHDGGRSAVWIYDGNVPYFNPKHAVLVIIGLLFLIGFIIPFTLLVLLGPLLQKKIGYLMVRFRITPILDAYQGPYKLQFCWWPGIMLVFRNFLMLAFATNVQGNPRVNMMLILTTVVIMFGIIWNTGTIYKRTLNNIIEAFFLVNLALLVGWTEFNRKSSSNFITAQAAISYTSVSLALAISIAVALGEWFHKHRSCLEWFKRHLPKRKKNEDATNDNVKECELPELRTQ